MKILQKVYRTTLVTLALAISVCIANESPNTNIRTTLVDEIEKVEVTDSAKVATSATSATDSVKAEATTQKSGAENSGSNFPIMPVIISAVGTIAFVVLAIIF